MDQRQNSRGYVSRRRKIAFTALLILFSIAFVMYTIPKIKQWVAGQKEQGVATGTINSLIGSFSRFFDTAQERPAIEHTNLLPRPLYVSFRRSGDTVVIIRPFRAGKKTVKDAVFTVSETGQWLRSTAFTSSVPHLVCRGSAQKQSSDFTIYYCAYR